MSCDLRLDLRFNVNPGWAVRVSVQTHFLNALTISHSLTLTIFTENTKMQRPTYGQPPPPTSPPLHHPVPQHVSTVPQLRSPPPPVSQQQQGAYGNPYQAQQGVASGNQFGAYGGFINDPTAQMGFQVGQTALKHGQEYMEQNVGYSGAITISAADKVCSSIDTSMSPL